MKFLLTLFSALAFFVGLHDLVVASPYFSVGLVNMPILFGNWMFALGSIVIALVLGLAAVSAKS